MPNPSFEQDTCFKSDRIWIATDHIKNWNHFKNSDGSLLTFNCQYYPLSRSPINANRGYRFPIHGDNMYIPALADSASMESYGCIYSNLLTPIVKGYKYLTSLHIAPVSKPSFRSMVIDMVGINFSVNEPDSSKNHYEHNSYGTYDVVNEQGVLNDTTFNHWYKITGIVEFDQDRQFILIGSFSDRADMKREYPNSLSFQAQYFLDAVTVIAHPELPKDTTLCQGQGFWLKPHMPKGSQFEWWNGTITDSVYINQPGTYWAMSYSAFDTTADTIQCAICQASHRPT